MSSLNLRVSACSAQGHRASNQDRFAIDEEQELVLVADGMGGLERGEQASGMAASMVPRTLKEKLAAVSCVEAIQHTLIEVSQAIAAAGQLLTSTGRIGTTIVLALYRNDQVWVAGVGDSRAYLLREREVRQLTTDHSLAQSLVAKGVLTQEQARHGVYKTILHKYLGCPWLSKKNVEVDSFRPLPSDRLLLGSDGLTNVLRDEDLQDRPHKRADLQTWAEALVQTALARGSRDNVTCIVVWFEKKGAPDEPFS